MPPQESAKFGADAKSNQKSNQKIIDLINADGAVTIGELMEATGLSESGIKKILRNLKKEGKILRVGSDKGGHWEIVSGSRETAKDN